MSSSPARVLVGDPDPSWKILSLVTDWIKHAETKAVGTLAAAGVTAGVLYNLTKTIKSPGSTLTAVVVLCVLCIVIAAISAGWALRPRLRAKEEPVSNLYFDHIARKHPKHTKGADYLSDLRALTESNAELVGEIAGQIFENAHVARAKYRWANIGLTSMLIGYLLLGLTALLTAMGRH